MRQFLQVFRDVKRAYDSDAPFDSWRAAGLVCKQGFYANFPVLKLQKAAWTNDSMRRVPNETGIFFSVWLDAPGVRKGHAHYNIHALKLRQLTEYALTSKEFADAFRRAFTPLRRTWPNVSVDYGPQTLMQGWIPLDLETFQRDVLALFKSFEEVSLLIDKLLSTRRSSRAI